MIPWRFSFSNGRRSSVSSAFCVTSSSSSAASSSGCGCGRTVARRGLVWPFAGLLFSSSLLFISSPSTSSLLFISSLSTSSVLFISSLSTSSSNCVKTKKDNQYPIYKVVSERCEFTSMVSWMQKGIYSCGYRVGGRSWINSLFLLRIVTFSKLCIKSWTNPLHKNTGLRNTK